MNAILTWLAGKILKYLLGLITTKIEEHAAQVVEDKRRGVVNDANVKAYEEAKDRAARIKAATDLLNRTSRTP